MAEFLQKALLDVGDSIPHALMKLPNANLAVVERAKVLEYLLNTEHRSGASKARFFAEFGFHRRVWARLAQALHEHAQRNDVCRIVETKFGPRYAVDGKLQAPDGRTPMVRTVWQMDYEEVAPRLITAYPLPRQGETSDD